ncbi:DMT family transporter [Breoghania sp. L-A4]|uniref:DMT family transporter n=1 Tax=Breoghania sp. L-A4 TaxID=2304600 RepID=UPI000E358B58|nr:DMT family transporter [Breoghania sp. L-A4]AXS40489.1 DMT family transporter [Breoghania sp. L-A4]
MNLTERTRAYLLLCVMPLFFTSNLIIGRAAIDAVEPFTLAFLRWALAAAILLPFAWGGLRRHAELLRGEWRLLTLLGFLGMWICGAVVYLALQFTTATNGTLIYTASPVLILLLERIFRGRVIGVREAIGIVLALGGVVTIVVKGSVDVLLGMRFNAGDLLFAGCALSWAVYCVLLKDRRVAPLPSTVLFAATTITGALTLAPFMAFEVLHTGRFPLDAEAWLSIGGIVISASLLAFSCFQYGIKVLGPSVTGLFMYLLPPYGVLMAIVFLGEEFHAFHAAGSALVMSGLILATAPSRLLTAPFAALRGARS